MRLDGPLVRSLAYLLLVVASAPTTAPANVEVRAVSAEAADPELRRLSNDILKAWGVSGAGLGLAVLGGGTLMLVRRPLAAIGAVAVGVAIGVRGFVWQREATAAYQAARREAFTRGKL